MALNGRFGKVLYGALFVVVLPVLLWAWSRAVAPSVRAPAIVAPKLGWSLLVLGAALVLSGWHGLWVHGRGLPMNAFPPRVFVQRGIYRVVGHPIYVGFCSALFGLALVTGSASLLWLVGPIVTLGCVALLFGYELLDLDRRFGADRPRAWLSMPRGGGRPSFAQRSSVFGTLLAPWLLLEQSIAWLDEVRPDSGSLADGMFPIRGGVYVAAALTPFVCNEVSTLRRFVARGWVASLVYFPLRWFLPWSDLDSFHVIVAVVCAKAFVETHHARGWARSLAALAVVAAVAAGTHSLAGVALGTLVAVAALGYERVWDLLRTGAEQIANSWREWQLGSVRVIVHGLWGALAAGSGVLIVLVLLGPTAVSAAVVATLAGLVGAALWAQWVEGSASLLRPYGFYGGVLGIILGSLAAPLFGTSAWSLLAAFSVAGPCVQALGRLRCLVQGCCHGSQAPACVGICYRHPRSRVVRLSPWAGLPLHPTPLYSMLANAWVLLVVTRLWFLELPAPFVAGVFLALNGLARFVEEAYRGESQTPVHRSLRLYQWVALCSVALGAGLTTLTQAPLTGSATPFLAAVVPSFVCALMVGAALGVDFPGSNARFSRLA